VTAGDQHSGAPAGAAALGAHVAECERCAAAAPPVQRIAAILTVSAVPVDPAGLSRRTLTALRPELARRTRAALWRQVAAALLLALVPLPVVLAYDAYLLRAAYEVASTLVPATVAGYLILSYAAFLVLLFATTYAAIPVLLAQRMAGGRRALARPAFV
jgi:hypothetical protein